MHSYVYIFFSLGTQLLFFVQLIKSLLIMEQTVDMIKEAYINEKELRLLGELQVLNQNILDTKEYLESSGSILDQLNENDLWSTDQIKKQLNDQLDHYSNKVSRFISDNFNYKVKIGRYYYCPKIYRQTNPKLDPNYPNWSFHFSSKC